MYRFLGSVAIAALLLGASAISSKATTCGLNCFGNAGVTDPVGFTFGDSAPTASSIVDDFLFTLTAGNWSFAGDTITVPGGIISGLELQLFTSGGTLLGSTTAADISIVNNTQSVTLTAPEIPVTLTGGDYYLEVTGQGGALLSYSRNLNAVFEGVGDVRPTPVPAALPLFASGLGLLGFWSRRRKATAA